MPKYYNNHFLVTVIIAIFLSGLLTRINKINQFKYLYF